MTDILFRLRLRGQAATKAGLDSTTRSVVKLDLATRKLNFGLATTGTKGMAGSDGLTELQKTLANLPGGLTKVSATLLALAPVLAATAGSAIALTSAMTPIVGVAAAAGDGLLAAAQGAGVFALAIGGLNTALKASSDPETYAAALAALPPSARKFSDSLVAMKPLLDDLRETAAAGFFPGAEKGLNLAARNFGVVQQVVAATAKVMGNLATRAGALVGSSAFGKDIKTIGMNNTKVIDTLGGALLHVVSALRHVAVAAGPLTQWLADMINKWALNAAVAAKAGRENGKLAAFFDSTKEVLIRLGSIVEHVTHGLFGIGKASKASGNDMWASIDRVAKRFDKWANSVSGQAALKDFFQQSKELMQTLLPIVGRLVSTFANTDRLSQFTALLKLLGPYADEAAVAFVYWKLAVTGVSIAMKAWAAAAAIAAFMTGGWTTAFWALNAAMAANPIGLVVIAIAAVAAGLYLAYQKSETFRSAVDWMWQALKDGFGWVQDNWPLLRSILTLGIYPAIKAIIDNFGSIKEAAKGAINAVIGIFNSGIGMINSMTPGPIKVAGHTIVPGIPDIPMIPTLATGGIIPPGGSAIVGDRPAGQGGELITAPGGAVVHDSKASAALGSGRRQIVVPVTVMTPDGSILGRAVASAWAEDAAFA